MPKRAVAFSLALPPRRGALPAYQWLGDALRAGILDGRLRPGARLPATRDIARDYDLARGTVVSAFEQLKAEGYLVGSVGSGTYVSHVLPEDLLQVRSKARPAIGRRRRGVAVSEFSLAVRPFPEATTGRTRAFRANQPALNLFPTTLWANVCARRLHRATTSQLAGCPALGYRPLREAIADYLRSSRGVNCSIEQIVIVSGVQQALDIAVRLFVNRGDVVAMENPGYVGAQLAFEGAGARIADLEIDAEGAELPGARLRRARLVYVTPAHQFPLGVTMTLRRRLELLEWAHTSKTIIFEDDYDSEFRYSGRPLPSMQGLDRHGLVLLAGSFGKVLFPSLRLGYAVIPPEYVDSFAAIASVTNRYPAALEQAALCDFITEGHFGRHVRRMREVYAERHGALIQAAREYLNGLLDVPAVEAGLETVGWIRCRLSAEIAAKAAAAHDVEVIPLGRYMRGNRRKMETALHLGFAAVDAAEIRRGARDLAAALKEELVRRRRRQA